MAQYFENEKARVYAFVSVLEEYIGIPISTNYEVSTGFCDFVFAGTIAIGKAKVEVVVTLVPKHLGISRAL